MCSIFPVWSPYLPDCTALSDLPPMLHAPQPACFAQLLLDLELLSHAPPALAAWGCMGTLRTMGPLKNQVPKAHLTPCTHNVLRPWPRFQLCAHKRGGGPDLGDGATGLHGPRRLRRRQEAAARDGGVARREVADGAGRGQWAGQLLVAAVFGTSRTWGHGHQRLGGLHACTRVCTSVCLRVCMCTCVCVCVR